jgi:hypothetical protein
MKYLVGPLAMLLFVFVATVLTNPSLLVIPYAYFWLGVVFAVVPSLTILSVFPRLLSKFVRTAAYFFLLALLFELTALHLHQWTFLGTQFIGWMEIFGFRFPFEEFFYWFVMGAISLLSYYEFFDDDQK